MSQIKNRKSAVKLFAVVVLAMALACMALMGCSGNSSSSSSASSSASASASTSSKIKVTVNIKGDYQGKAVSENKTVEVADGATALEALQASGIDVVVKDSSMGKYVDSIGGLATSGSNGWMYKVNGQSPTKSAAEYNLKSGDTVDWEYSAM